MPQGNSWLQGQSNIALIGLMGSGKSTVGRQLADWLNTTYVDTDASIEYEQGRSINEIFATQGEPFFRQLEREEVRRAAAHVPSVIATGGGVFLDAANRDALHATGVSIYLEATPEELWERLRHARNRPLLKVPDPLARLRELTDLRHPIYSTATFRIQVAGRTPQEIVAAILAILKNQPPASPPLAAKMPDQPRVDTASLQRYEGTKQPKENRMPDQAPPFVYQKPFPLTPDQTSYRLLASDMVKVETFAGKEVVTVAPEALTFLAETAFHDIAFYLRPAHIKQVAAILEDPEASDNDREVALTLLRNAEVSSHGILPFCQDTGTATVVGKKGQQVWTGTCDEEYISRGVYNCYTQENLRYSQNAALDMWKEVNTGTNLPAQIDLYATEGSEYSFLFVAKGGGSANKTYLYQETRATVNPGVLEKFLTEKMMSLGTAACPPYHLAFVIGGTSAEACLKTVKLASTKYLDNLPTSGNQHGQAFRDLEMEARMLEAARNCGFGAQFGGKYFALDVRVIRLPRHGASCPIGLGVSCSADRNIKAKINKDGIWIEQLETDPGQYIPEKFRRLKMGEKAVRIDLNRPMAEILDELKKHPITTQLLLNGPVIVARDIAHAKLKERVDNGQGLPDYFKNHPVYYAGPAKTPAGMPSGSFGPTTAGRMDGYVDLFQSLGGSMIMIAKGNRSPAVTDACQKHGGFYLGSIGGPAAILAQDNIKKVEILEYPELGMEAIWKIEVQDFPAFLLVDDKGHDFFRQIASCGACSSGLH